MKRRRCLIPADAYYEWRRDASGKKSRTGAPFLFRRADQAPMAFAGLWECWCGPEGSEVDTACILTTDANGATVAVHERMPAILERHDFDAWLDCDTVPAEKAAALLKPAAVDTLEFFEIGPAVNKIAHDDPSIQAPRFLL